MAVFFIGGLMYKNEQGYLKLLNDVYKNGVEVPDRTDVGTSKALFGGTITFDEPSLPTHRFISPRMAFEELWFFMRGDTDTTKLEEKGINFWKGNTSRESLDALGLVFLDEGDLGAAYSNQWRNYGGYDVDHAMRYGSHNIHSGTRIKGIDQLNRLIDGLRDNPYGRRHIVNLWNPLEEPLMALTPCWHKFQCVVLPTNGIDTLYISLDSRSLDIAFGMLYAVSQYQLLQQALCNMFGFENGGLQTNLAHVHIYKNQYQFVEEILSRDYWSNAKNTIALTKSITTLDDLLSLEWSDWVMDYNDYNKTKFTTPTPKMAV